MANARRDQYPGLGAKKTGVNDLASCPSRAAVCVCVRLAFLRAIFCVLRFVRVLVRLSCVSECTYGRVRKCVLAMRFVRLGY